MLNMVESKFHTYKLLNFVCIFEVTMYYYSVQPVRPMHTDII